MSTKHKDIITRGAELPAEVLEQTIIAAKGVEQKIPAKEVIKKTGDYWHMLGPGLTTGASDDDPSGILTYSQTGARFGFSYLWMAVFTFPLMAVVQEMCARIGLVTGRGLAGNIRLHFNKRILIICTTLLFVANTINIGADLGAMAKAMQLFSPRLNFAGLVIGFTFVSLMLQIFTPYVKYARYLKWLALVLLSYVFSTLLAGLDWPTVLRNAVVPNLQWNKDTAILISAVLGTTISPYLFFWQTSQEVEEEVLQGKTTLQQRRLATPPEDIKSMRVDVWSGMFLSNLVMFFIIAASGALLYSNGITDITSAAQAAEALKPFAGESSSALFALGIIGTGMLAIPVLAGSTSYAMAESFRWREGLYRELAQARAFYGIIIISMLVGLGINFIGVDPIKALIYAAVANGLTSPLILALIVLLSSNRAIMGHWTNKKSTTVIGWLVTLVMTVAGVAAIWALFA